MTNVIFEASLRRLAEGYSSWISFRSRPRRLTFCVRLSYQLRGVLSLPWTGVVGWPLQYTAMCTPLLGTRERPRCYGACWELRRARDEHVEIVETGIGHGTSRCALQATRYYGVDCILLVAPMKLWSWPKSFACILLWSVIMSAGCIFFLR